MWGLGPATKVYLAVGATDLRKGFDGNGAKIRISLGDNFGERSAFCDGVK
jgi:hypothetical protein